MKYGREKKQVFPPTLVIKEHHPPGICSLKAKEGEKHDPPPHISSKNTMGKMENLPLALQSELLIKQS